MAKVLTIEEAAALLRTSPRTVYAYLRAGKLPGRKIGKRWLIPEERLLEYLAGDDERAERRRQLALAAKAAG